MSRALTYPAPHDPRGLIEHPLAVRYLILVQNMRTKAHSIWTCMRCNDDEVRDHIRARLRNLRRKPKYKVRVRGFIIETALDAVRTMRDSGLTADQSHDVILQCGKR